MSLYIVYSTNYVSNLLYEIIKNTVGFFNYIPQIDKSMGFGILFVIGLIASIH